MTLTHHRAKSLVPLCLSFALFAFVLTPALFAVSSSLSLRSIPSPSQSFLGTVTHLAALACIVIVPCILAAIGKHCWGWSAFYAAASGSIFLALRAGSEPHFAQVIQLPIGVVSFLVFFALMITAAIFGVFIRASYIKQKWIALSIQVLGCLAVAFGAFVYLAIPLFVE